MLCIFRDDWIINTLEVNRKDLWVKVWVFSQAEVADLTRNEQ